MTITSHERSGGPIRKSVPIAVVHIIIYYLLMDLYKNNFLIMFWLRPSSIFSFHSSLLKLSYRRNQAQLELFGFRQHLLSHLNTYPYLPSLPTSSCILTYGTPTYTLTIVHYARINIVPNNVGVYKLSTS